MRRTPVDPLIAVPLFLGANALKKIPRPTPAGAWTDDPTTLEVVEPTLRFEVGEAPSADDVSTDGELLGLSARSESETCFYLVVDTGDQLPEYANDEDCGLIEDQELFDKW